MNYNNNKMYTYIIKYIYIHNIIIIAMYIVHL